MATYTHVSHVIFKLVLGILLGLFESFLTVVCLELFIPKDTFFWDESVIFLWSFPLVILWSGLALWLLFRRPFEKPIRILLGIALGLILSFLTIMCLEILLPGPNPFMRQHFDPWLGGLIAAIWLTLMLWMMLRIPRRGTLQAQGFDALPESLSALVDAVVESMGYRRSVRAEVRQELTDHFTDALADCDNEADHQERIRELVDAFGNPKLLGTLLRRAKKRCRPLWRTLVVRAFQLLGVCVLLLIIHFIRLSFATPNIQINYAEKTTRLSQRVTDDRKNAAVWYEKAIAVYRSPGKLFDEETVVKVQELEPTTWISKLTAEENNLLEQWYAANEDSIRYLSKGTELPYCWWHYNVPADESLYSMKIPEYIDLRKLVSLLCWKAQQEAAAGDFRPAFEKLYQSYRFGMHLKGPKTLIEQLVGTRVQRNAMLTARHIFFHCQVPTHILDQYRTTLLTACREDTFTAKLITEEYAFMDMIQRLYTDNGSGQGVLIPRQLVKFNNQFDYLDALDVPVLSKGVSYGASLLSAGRKNMTRMVQELFEQAQAYSQHSPYEIHRNHYHDVFDKLENSSAIDRFRYWPIYMFMPALGRVSEIMSRTRCEIQATTTISAILEYQQVNGQWPAALTDLVQTDLLSAIPADPYSDGRLVYHRTDDGFTLYSVGVNFIDDGGVPASTENGQPGFWGNNGDTVFWPVQAGD